jgi:hypothetical protein
MDQAHPWRAVVVGVLVAAAVPFAVTAWYRLAPDAPAALPFVAVAGGAAALLARRTARPVALGLLVGAALWALALAWLLGSLGDGMRAMGLAPGSPALITFHLDG